MAYKVKSECINPATGQRVFAGGFLDPAPNRDEIMRLTRANAIEERPDAEMEAWRQAEKQRATPAVEGAKAPANDGALADRVARLEAAMRDMGQQLAPLRAHADEIAKLNARFDQLPAHGTEIATLRSRLDTLSQAGAAAGQSTPEKEKAAEDEIKRRAGGRAGDDNDQRKK
jgi:hypothetical protein